VESVSCGECSVWRVFRVESVPCCCRRDRGRREEGGGYSVFISSYATSKIPKNGLAILTLTASRERTKERAAPR